MSELLSSITGGGGGSFIASFASSTVNIPSGATGTIATITPPTGERVLLTALACTIAAQTNLTTVTSGGVDVIDAVILMDNDQSAVNTNQFYIGHDRPNQSPILFNIDEAVDIKTNVATSTATIYTYQFGV